MLKNYIKIALRTIYKKKLYSGINILGLSLGIACSIIIFLFIQDELSFDKFHENGAQIYRVEQIQYDRLQSEIEPLPFYDSSSPEGEAKFAWLPLPLGPVLKERIPEIENVVRPDVSSLIVRNGDASFEEDILFADANFFEFFSFPLIEGNAATVLNSPKNIVLTPQIAKKYFGDESPIGKTLVITIQDEEKIFTVSGLAQETPSNSSIRFSFVAPIESRPFYDFHVNRWGSFNTPLFVSLVPGTDVNQFNTKLNDFVNERFKDRMEATRTRIGLPGEAVVMEFGVTPIQDIHLNAAVEWDEVSNPLYSYILGSIALLILLVACINYITLALARSTERAKEVGIRKSSGAKRSQIAMQFWGETQLLALLSMISGVVIAELTLPLFNSLSGRALAIDYMQNIELISVLALITMATGFIAGMYPAAILSRFEPVNVLKGSIFTSFKPRLTKVLLTAQYSLSVFLIISSIVIYSQLDYVNTKSLGYNEEQVVFVPTYTGWNEKGTNLMELYRNELQAFAGVEDVSGMAPAFTTGSNSYGFKINGESKGSYIYFVDENLVETLDIEIVKGRNFDEAIVTDITGSIIVNEAFVKEMGFDNPIGELVPWKGAENPSTIVGVVKDFHFQSLEASIRPMLFHMDPQEGGVANIAIRLGSENVPETLEQMRTSWAKVAPTTPFDFWFLDEAVAEQYEDYQKWQGIMTLSTMIAILVACLGLFGLTGITVVNKTKEIGIRKVLGAGVDQIMIILNKDIVKLIVVSLAIASPASWYIMQQWLSNFAYHIDLEIGLFAIGALCVILVTLFTVSYHTLKAASSNPIDSLKRE